jgi:hypothetical protein
LNVRTSPSVSSGRFDLSHLLFFTLFNLNFFGRTLTLSAYYNEQRCLFNALIDTLREEALHAVKASQDAADYATNEESRAESQWDTQGLEASYLAAGQAGQAKQWADAVEELQSERDDLLKTNTDISLGALFKADLGGVEEVFFLAGVAGGQVIQVDNIAVTVITAQSPLAARVRGLKIGETFTLPNGKLGEILAIE